MIYLSVSFVCSFIYPSIHLYVHICLSIHKLAQNAKWFTQYMLKVHKTLFCTEVTCLFVRVCILENKGDKINNLCFHCNILYLMMIISISVLACIFLFVRRHWIQLRISCRINHSHRETNPLWFRVCDCVETSVIVSVRDGSDS